LLLSRPDDLRISAGERLSLMMRDVYPTRLLIFRQRRRGILK